MAAWMWMQMDAQLLYSTRLYANIFRPRLHLGKQLTARARNATPREAPHARHARAMHHRDHFHPMIPVITSTRNMRHTMH